MVFKLNTQVVGVKLLEFASPQTDNASFMTGVNSDRLERVYKERKRFLGDKDKKQEAQPVSF